MESPSAVRDLEKLLTSGDITIVLVYADWCGACHRFRDNIWNPMLKENAIHNRIAVRDDMMNKTSLSKAKFDYLPSILVVDEKGDIQTFKTPEGKLTNAMPTPRNIQDMTRIVNVPVASPQNEKLVKAEGAEAEAEAEAHAEESENQTNVEKPKNRNTTMNTNEILTPFQKETLSNYNYTGVIRTRPIATPIGTSYVPVQRGGSLLKMLERLAKRVKVGRKTRKHK